MPSLLQIFYHKILLYLKNIRKTPLLNTSSDLRCLFIPIFLGVGIAVYFSLPVEPDLWWGICFIITSLIGLWFLRYSSTRHTFLLALCLIAVGFTTATLRVILIGDILLKEPVRNVIIRGTIIKSEMLEGGFSRVTLGQVVPIPGIRLPLEERVSRSGVYEKVHKHHRSRSSTTEQSIYGIGITSPDSSLISHLQNIRIRLPYGHYQPGDILSARVHLFPPSSPVTVGGFDFQRYAFFHRISATGYSTGPISITPTPTQRSIPQLRHLIYEHINHTLTGDEAAIAAALMIGKRDAITTHTEESMRGSGLYHILSISGLHMAMMGGLIFYALRYTFCCFPYFVLHYPVKKWAALCTILGMAFYMILAGATIPTQRAFAMASLIMLGIAMDRPIISFRSLTVVASFLLLLWPELLIDISFQLSFAAVFALIALYQRLGHSNWYQQPSRHLLKRLFRNIAVLFLSSSAAVLATSIFSAFHFHQINLYGPIANLLGIPLAGLWVMPTGVLACLSIPFGLDTLFWQLMGYGIKGLLTISSFISHWPGATIPISQFPVTSFLMIITSLLMGFLFQRWWKIIALIPLSIGLFYLANNHPPDLLIRGTQIVVRDDNQLVTFNKPHPFVLKQWQHLYGSLPIFKASKNLDFSSFSCQQSFCEWYPYSFKITLDTGYSPHKEIAATTDLWIAPRYTKEKGLMTKIIDKNRLYIYGVHAIWLDDNNIHIKTDADYRGKRPWVIQKTEDR